jgi:uncharacterized protein
VLSGYESCSKSQWHEWASHAYKIKVALGIAGVSTEESHWQHIARKKDTYRDAEIDLLIDRADDCIHLCEIKFCNTEFVIDHDYAEQLERKKQVFQNVTRTRKTVFLTMITPYGVVKNDHYIGLVDQQLTMDDLF